MAKVYCHFEYVVDLYLFCRWSVIEVQGSSGQSGHAKWIGWCNIELCEVESNRASAWLTKAIHRCCIELEGDKYSMLCKVFPAIIDLTDWLWIGGTSDIHLVFWKPCQKQLLHFIFDPHWRSSLERTQFLVKRSYCIEASYEESGFGHVNSESLQPFNNLGWSFG